MSTGKRPLRVIRDKGERSIDQNSCDMILTENVVYFLKNKENIISVGEVTFVHDKASCM